MEPFDFTGRHVVVTGGGQGIGRVTAKLFAQRGARVTVADIDGDAGEWTTSAIRGEGGEAIAVRADVAVEQEVEALFRRAREAFGPAAVLVNNAGIGAGGDIFSRSFDAWQRVLAVNLGGTYLCSRSAAAQMKGAGGGAIVNIASTRAIMSEANTEPYSASKGGILALTHALAVSLGPYGIRVNSISPGWIDVSAERVSADAKPAGLRAADHVQHPAGRVGRPCDIAEACAYLCSPASGFITGANLVVDGGMTRKMIYVE